MQFIAHAIATVRTNIANEGIGAASIQVFIGAAVVATILYMAEDQVSTAWSFPFVQAVSLFLTYRWGYTDIFEGFVWQAVALAVIVLVAIVFGLTLSAAGLWTLVGCVVFGFFTVRETPPTEPK